MFMLGSFIIFSSLTIGSNLELFSNISRIIIGFGSLNYVVIFMWKAWFVLVWLTLLTIKILYPARIASSASYCCKHKSSEGALEYCCLRDTSQAVALFIMIIIYILAGISVILVFPDY